MLNGASSIPCHSICVRCQIILALSNIEILNIFLIDAINSYTIDNTPLCACAAVLCVKHGIHNVRGFYFLFSVVAIRICFVSEQFPFYENILETNCKGFPEDYYVQHIMYASGHICVFDIIC